MINIISIIHIKVKSKRKKMNQLSPSHLSLLLPDNLESFSLAQLDEFMKSVQNKINNRIQKLHHFVAEDNLQAFKDYFTQYPEDFSDEVWKMLPANYLDSINLSIPRMQFMQYMMQETSYFKSPLSTSQSLVHEHIIREACDNPGLIMYMKKNDFWQPLLKNFCLNSENLRHIEKEETIHALVEDNYITMNKELIEKLYYYPSYLDYALKHHLIEFSEKEFSHIYRDTWWKMNSEFLDRFYEHYLDDKTRNMDLHTIFEATNKNKGSKTAGMSKILSCAPAICHFMLTHHYVSEKMANNIVEHVLENYNESCAQENFKTFCHIMFSHYPEMTEKIMKNLKTLPFQGNLTHGHKMIAVAEKIQQYEKIHQIVQDNAQHQPSESHTPFKSKI
jgi:uncharacterized protein (DUF924 family)